MQALAGVAGALLVLLMLAEFFVTFLLPRRVRRDPRLARGFVRFLWRPWRATARLLPDALADTVLGFFGPVALLTELVVWALGLVVGFTLLHWAFGSRVGGHARSFVEDLYFSGGEFLSSGTGPALGTPARVLALVEAATGIGVVFVVIGYLPAVFGAFSRREVAISQLDPRAGSPATAGALLRRVARTGRWDELEVWLRDAEDWAAELMETQLSYPLLAWYRSQHVNQDWLKALTVIVDTSAVVIAARAEGAEGQAELTYAVGRHALSDIALQLRVTPERVPGRLADADFDDLRRSLEAHDGTTRAAESMRRRLDDLREGYEGNAAAIAQLLALRVPPWTATADSSARFTSGHSSSTTL